MEANQHIRNGEKVGEHTHWYSILAETFCLKDRNPTLTNLSQKGNLLTRITGMSKYRLWAPLDLCL